jgi:hypothetical protein
VASFHNDIRTNYGEINQAGRDINITSAEALTATAELRAALARVALTPEQGRIAAGGLDEVEQELRKAHPDKDWIATRLESFTAMLKSAGAFAAAGAALVGPIGVLAGFIGPLGDAALSLARRSAPRL